MGRVIVLGSLNVDLEVHVPAMPSSGEKVMGDRLMRFAGGKGGNQAVAARAAPGGAKSWAACAPSPTTCSARRCRARRPC